MKYFSFIIILIVVVAVVFGFFLAGSPNSERLRRFDERRIQDLQTIQSEIINYWANKERLPQQLSDLQDNIKGFSTPKDPETGSGYSYMVNSDFAFTLCADFSDSNAESPYYEQFNWQHNAGHFCFERNIDPEIYPPSRKASEGLRRL